MNASSDTNVHPPSLNPEVLPSDLGRQLQVLQHVTAATTGMVVWELVLDMYNIYRMLFKNRLSIPSTVYILSRVFTLGFIVFCMQLTSAGGDCRFFVIVITIFWALVSSSTAMLFLFLIWAIFRDRPVIVGFFIFLWVGVVGGAMTICFADPPVAHHFPNSSLCLLTSYPAYAGAGVITPAVFDTCVFFAVSLQVFPWYEVNSRKGWREQMVFFVWGKGLPRLSKALLQGGQKYYLLSFVANIIILATYFSPSVPSFYHILIAPFLISLINSMACRIYCDIKFRGSQISDLPTVECCPPSPEQRRSRSPRSAS